MITSNEFYQGVDKDTDRLRVANSSLRDANNVRITNKDGQGFVVTNIGGNEQAFSLSPGFIPLGYDEYNGISYILSVNSTTGEGEVGTYPSPNPACVGGFQHVYSPLTNFTQAVNPNSTTTPVTYPFRTTLFNLDCQHQARLFVRVDYDDSVNIYWTDYKNPIRSVNSGFNQDGLCTGRYYWNGSFPNAVDLISETCVQPIVTGINIQPGGCHKAGNWFFFARYNTLDFNPTSFLSESNAVQMSPNADSDIAQIGGALGTVNTGKQVTLTFSNLDESYPYLEIGYLFYHDGTVESGLIDELYNIIPGTTSLSINITGCEDVTTLDTATLLRKKIDYDVVKDIDQLENRLWAANCRSRTKFHPDLLTLANSIIARPDDSLAIGDGLFQDVSINDNQIQYKNYQKTYSNAGYFRGEAYPFAVRFVFTSGRLSDPLPVSGYDAWLDPTASVLNADGILRFPNLSTDLGQSPFTDSNNNIRVMGVKFDMTNAIPIFNSSPWLQDNVCGLYFTRGDRNPNLIYQGISVQCYSGSGLANPLKEGGNYWFPDQQSNQCPSNGAAGFVNINESTNFAPRLTGRFPFTQYCNPLVGSSVHTVFTGNAAPKVGYFGLYSPDHFFNKNLVNKSYKAYKFATLTAISVDQIDASVYPSQTNDFVSYSWNNTPGIVSTPFLYNVQEWNPSPTGPGFVSLFDEGSETNAFSLAYLRQDGTLGNNTEWFNRKMAFTRYIGVDGTSGGFSADGLYNIYSQDPVTGYILTDQYNVKSVNYFKISNFISISSLSGINSTIFYRGDCFIQRTYFKDLYNPLMYYTSSQQDDSSPARYFKFGSMMSFVTENTHNTAMRFNSGGNKYFPGFGFSTGADFIYNDGTFESDVLNVGYDRQLSPDGAFGFDKNIPFRANEYHTRVIYSNQHTPNAFTDGYRSIDIAAQRDFDLRLGPINALRPIGARNVIVQSYGVSFLYINDRAMLSDSASSGQLLLGNGDVLAAKQQTITDQYGTQHQWSVVPTRRALYGIDANKRSVWRLEGGGQFEVISDTKKYRTEMYEIIEQGSNGDHSDIIENIFDNPVCLGGITGFYERKYQDVGWSFIFNNNTKVNKSIRFNELIDGFTGSYDNLTAFYLPINEDFFSFNPNIFRSLSGTPTGLGDAYIEGRRVDSLGNPNNCKFYGTTYNMSLKWVVNFEPDAEKAFDYIALNASAIDPLEINYKTINQDALQNPFRNPAEVWMVPSYRENLWRVPIRRADTVNGIVNNIFSPNSYMRGTYMETELIYNTNESIFVKSALTNVRKSYQ
jgi:hypothetical protein